LRIAPARDDARLLEHFEVPGDRGETDVERRRELEDGGVSRGEALDNGPPRRVAEGGKRDVNRGGKRHGEGSAAVDVRV